MKKMRSLLRSKKGQLFVIEAFIAVSVMIIMVTALYQVQVTTTPKPEPDYSKNVYAVISSLDQQGILERLVLAIKNNEQNDITLYKNIISQAIYAALPDNGEFVFYYTNVTTDSIISESWINENIKIPANAVGIDYLFVEINGNFEPYVAHVYSWIEGV